MGNKKQGIIREKQNAGSEISSKSSNLVILPGSVKRKQEAGLPDFLLFTCACFLLISGS
jgi:hypothetical protein